MKKPKQKNGSHGEVGAKAKVVAKNRVQPSITAKTQKTIGPDGTKPARFEDVVLFRFCLFHHVGTRKLPEKFQGNVYPIIEVVDTSGDGVILQTRTLTFVDGYGEAFHTHLRGMGWDEVEVHPQPHVEDLTYGYTTWWRPLLFEKKDEES